LPVKVTFTYEVDKLSFGLPPPTPFSYKFHVHIWIKI